MRKQKIIAFISTILVLLPNIAIATQDIRTELHRAVQSEDWKSAIEILDRMIEIYPGESEDLKTYKEQLQKRIFPTVVDTNTENTSGQETSSNNTSQEQTPKRIIAEDEIVVTCADPFSVKAAEDKIGILIKTIETLITACNVVSQELNINEEKPLCLKNILDKLVVDYKSEKLDSAENLKVKIQVKLNSPVELPRSNWTYISVDQHQLLLNFDEFRFCCKK
jgi:hypothetical protein